MIGYGHTVWSTYRMAIATTVYDMILRYMIQLQPYLYRTGVIRVALYVVHYYDTRYDTRVHVCDEKRSCYVTSDKLHLFDAFGNVSYTSNISAPG